MIDLSNDQGSSVASGPPRERVPRAAALLGAAGLLPVAGAIVAMVASAYSGRQTVFATSVAAFEEVYATMIFNFLGGMWWGLASARVPRVSPRVFVAAVAPTLTTIVVLLLSVEQRPAAFRTYGLAIGAAILATLSIDRFLANSAIAPGWWMRLRLPLSLGLGLGTAVIALLAPA